jgi:hypothetical protein
LIASNLLKYGHREATSLYRGDLLQFVPLRQRSDPSERHSKLHYQGPRKIRTKISLSMLSFLCKDSDARISSKRHFQNFLHFRRFYNLQKLSKFDG